MQYKAKSRKARQKAKWKMYPICFIFLYVEAWIHDRINSSEWFCCLSRKNTPLLSNQFKCSMASPTSPSFSSQGMVQDMLVSSVDWMCYTMRRFMHDNWQLLWPRKERNHRNIVILTLYPDMISIHDGDLNVIPGWAIVLRNKRKSILGEGVMLMM